MHPKKHLYLFCCLALGYTACKKSDSSPPEKPMAGFTYNIQQAGFLPAKVIFTSNSKNASSLQWYFGDGQTTAGIAVEHTFTKAGTYQVKLVVSNAGGKDSTTQAVTIVQNKPKAGFDFTLVNEGQFPCQVNFTNTSEGADTYQWFLENGQTATTLHTQYSYPLNKIYQVKLVVSNDAGKDSITKPVMISPIDKSVVVYLITPRDQPYNPKYYNILKACVQNLHTWYKTQLGNKTFTLNPLIVDTLRGQHDKVWYNSHNGDFSGSDPRFYGYSNTLYEMQALLGNAFNTTRYTYFVYVAAPGGGAGATGFCAMGDQDLDGLLGINPENLDPNRWIGGGGHELGHAFGLPHPDNQNPQAIMWTGYTIYPNCILQQEDKNILQASPFFK
ncbi:PKD domain-containing protein [Chitinophaga defluvii]|uniref:PKD domain-containing protein n=1 Tax=Chitinophaga defluvii TaxID=3163343 RepID=A0ABV2TBL9_9BACT